MTGNRSFGGEDSDNKGGEISYKEIFSPTYIKPTIIGCFMSFFQQLSGINAVIFYSAEIFATKTDKSGTFGTALVGVFNLLSTAFSILLLKWFGRKDLLLFG